MPKAKAFAPEEKRILAAHGLKWVLWTPLQQLPNSLIIINNITGEVRVIEKRKIPS